VPTAIFLAEDLNVLKKQLTSPATLLERKQPGGR
jgi:hypothetical protein